MNDGLTGGRADETETESLRRERDAETTDPRDRMADVPLAPHSAGVLGTGVAGAGDEEGASASAESDSEAAERRESR